jgi:aconitate decarboxylase
MHSADEFTSHVGTGVTYELSDFIAALRLADIPEHVQKRSMVLALDGIGCAAVGSGTFQHRAVLEGLRGLDEAGSTPVWFTGVTASTGAACVVNGVAVQAWELDDYHLLGPLHVASVVLPAALSTAQVVGIDDGADLLLAIVAGQEVGPRVGMACGGMAPIQHGWHNGAVFGTLASAAASAKLRGLDARSCEHAFGLAGTQSAGLMSAQYEAMSTYLHHGFAARAGVVAAALAQAGVTGITDVVAREYGGLAANFSHWDDCDPRALCKNLGELWEVERIAVKPYANMAGVHLPIDLSKRLLSESRGTWREVHSIRIGVPHWLYIKGGAPLSRPMTTVGAQMSIRYGVAVALIDGNALPPQFADDRIQSDDVHSLAGLIDVFHDPRLDGRPGASFACSVSITQRDGSVREAEGASPRGSHLDPFSDDEIIDKFFRLTTPLLGAGRATRIADLVLNLPRISVAELLSALGDPLDEQR